VTKTDIIFEQLNLSKISYYRRVQRQITRHAQDQKIKLVLCLNKIYCC